MEENGKSKNAADEMISSVKEYVALKIDELKLKGVEGLSLLCSKMIFIFLAATAAPRAKNARTSATDKNFCKI